MRLWTIIKLLAALGVLTVLAFTGLFAYHVTVSPLGGVFEKIIPKQAQAAAKKPDEEFTKMLDSTVLPDIDPGEKAFQKAHELLALGKLSEARERLNTLITTFPSSASAPIARRIVGEMNLDEVLSTTHMEGKRKHVVVRGNSFLGIAAEHHTTLDCLMHLNGMMELKGIQPGNEFTVMPLEFRLLIEPARLTLSVLEGDRFICEYPILHLGVTGKLAAGRTKIGAKAAELAGKSISPQSKDYRAAEKSIQLTKPNLLILSSSGKDPTHVRGIVLKPEDIEEISLLTRVGNDVEIR